MVITRDIRDEIKNSVSSGINSILRSDEFLDQLIQKVTENVAKTLKVRFTELEKKLADNSAVIVELKEETALLRYENECLSQKYDDIEQASRINKLRIFQVKEKSQEKLAQEVTNIIKSHLGVTIDHNEILSCTRIGKKVNNKPRGILLKLTNIHKKQDIFNKKKNFKRTGIVIKEDLTDLRLKIMEAAIEKTSLKGVWTYNGRVFVLKDGKKIMIKSKKDLDRL
nr:unnamed protein product [Callosobruchus analis]